MRLSKRQLKRIIREEYSRLRRRGLIKESYAYPNFDSTWDTDEEDMPLQSLEECAADQVSNYFDASIIADLQKCGIASGTDLDNAASKGCAEPTLEAIQYAFEGLDKDGSGHWDYHDYKDALYDALYF